MVSKEESFLRAKIKKKKVASKLHCSNLQIRVSNCVCMGVFLYEGQDPLVGVIRSFTRATYRVVIDNHVLSFMYDVHDGPASLVLQEDNCGRHRATSIATYLHNEEVEWMQWPSQNPDLNPIENVWRLMKNRVRKQAVPPKNTVHLFQILSQMWNSLPDSYFKSLVASLPARVKMVREHLGRSTNY